MHPIEAIARKHANKAFFLYLGRNVGLPICLEGALKLKEISYIPTEAYSAGEMKHGPIALLDDQTPVVVIATDSHVYDKVVSNIQETRARGAHVIAIATEGNEDIHHHAEDVITVPKANEYLEPILAIVPLQLLAYRIARSAARTSTSRATSRRPSPSSDLRPTVLLPTNCCMATARQICKTLGALDEDRKERFGEEARENKSIAVVFTHWTIADDEHAFFGPLVRGIRNRATTLGLRPHLLRPRARPLARGGGGRADGAARSRRVDRPRRG